MQGMRSRRPAEGNEGPSYRSLESSFAERRKEFRVKYLARIFGKRRELMDWRDYQVIAYEWRGTLYVWRVTPVHYV